MSEKQVIAIVQIQHMVVISQYSAIKLDKIDLFK